MYTKKQYASFVQVFEHTSSKIGILRCASIHLCRNFKGVETKNLSRNPLLFRGAQKTVEDPLQFTYEIIYGLAKNTLVVYVRHENVRKHSWPKSDQQNLLLQQIRV